MARPLVVYDAIPMRILRIPVLVVVALGACSSAPDAPSEEQVKQAFNATLRGGGFRLDTFRVTQSRQVEGTAVATQEVEWEATVTYTHDQPVLVQADGTTSVRIRRKGEQRRLNGTYTFTRGESAWVLQESPALRGQAVQPGQAAAPAQGPPRGRPRSTGKPASRQPGTTTRPD